MSENDTYIALRERLNNITSSFTVYNDFRFDFIQYKRAHPDWNKRSQIEKLGVEKKSALFYNYQTLMCKDCPDRLERAKEANVQALTKEPQNFIALCHAVELALNSKGTPAAAHCIEQYLSDLEKVSTDPKVKMLAQTEVAFSYNRLHPMFYEKAIKVYEDTFKELPQHYLTDENDPGFHYKILRAKIGLGKLYNKVSTRGMANAYNSSPYKPSTFYMKVKTLLLDDVINSPEIIGEEWNVQKVNGLAWTELAIAADKYIYSRAENVAIEDSLKPERCFRNALECMTEGSYQLEKYGQFKRKTAKTLDDYRECIELLKRALYAEPDRHTTMYEIGNTFKRMWQISNSNDGFDDKEAEEGVVEEEEEEKSNGGDSGANSEWKKASRKKTIGFPCAPNNLPKPTHKIKQYFQNNIKTGLHDDYLLESQKYFKMAKETGNCASCIYTIELARTYISQGDTETAEQLFGEAEQMELNVMHAAYLFEQRALFLKEQTGEDVSHEMLRKRDEHIMFYCRECIRYHAECKSHLIVAFHELHELLYRKTQEKENKDNCLLQREYMILFNAINRSKNVKDVITKFTINSKAVYEILELIKELCAKIDQDYNSSTALTYLTILHEAGELARVSIATILDISSRAADACSYPDHILSNLYTWLMKIKYPESEKTENSLFMVVMSNDEYVDRITNTLAKCNLPVRIFNAQDQGDIERYSSLKPDDISTLLIVDHTDWDSEESRKMIGKFLKKVESKCFVSCMDEKVKRFQRVDLKVWRFETEDQPSRNKAVKMGFELLNVLFMQ